MDRLRVIPRRYPQPPERATSRSVPQEAVVDQLFYERAHSKSKRAGDDLCHKFRVCLGGGQHLAGFRQVAGHSSFTQDMLSRLQRCAGDLAVQVRPGPDHDRVDVGRFHNGLPLLVGLRNAELASHTSCRIRPQIRNGDQLHPRDLLEPGNVPCPECSRRLPRSRFGHVLPPSIPSLKTASSPRQQTVIQGHPRHSERKNGPAVPVRTESV